MSGCLHSRAATCTRGFERLTCYCLCATRMLIPCRQHSLSRRVQCVHSSRSLVGPEETCTKVEVSPKFFEVQFFTKARRAPRDVRSGHRQSLQTKMGQSDSSRLSCQRNVLTSDGHLTARCRSQFSRSGASIRQRRVWPRLPRCKT